jgi:hypothetical protein
MGLRGPTGARSRKFHHFIWMAVVVARGFVQTVHQPVECAATQSSAQEPTTVRNGRVHHRVHLGQTRGEPPHPTRLAVKTLEIPMIRCDLFVERPDRCNSEFEQVLVWIAKVD